MTGRLLHFTLGPVQGFVAEARRTRDLWAGSFLLSWLSGHAMVALVDAGGTIEFPQISGDELFEAIAAKKPVISPHIGSLPNRFKAEVSNVAGDPGGICKTAVLEKWDKLQSAVWNQFIAPIATKGRDTQEIWKRQVGNFWEIAWVVGDEPGPGPDKGADGAWLDQRKNWRSNYPHQPHAEGGDHCRLMGQLQEISGYLRFGGEKAPQQGFWEALTEQKYVHPETKQKRRLLNLNIRLDERLSAIALIKRLFPLLDNIEEIIGWRPGADAFQTINWPSISYIAAVPWLKAAEAGIDKAERNGYFETVQTNTAGGVRGETETHCFGFPSENFFKLDGHMFHRDAIAWTKEDIFQTDVTKPRKTIDDALVAIQNGVGGGSKVQASEFYAVLLMDGDRIGALLREHEAKVKAGLSEFAKMVKDYFAPPNDSNGVLVYAGGDDVLALVPLDTAISAAEAIREKYAEAFSNEIAQLGNQADPDAFTMSAAVVFAQYKIPLRTVLRQAHHYLDDVAKERNGRDSLAVAVMKPGGIAADWVSCWRKTTSPVATLQSIACELQRDPEFTSSFLYNVRDRYAPLLEPKGLDRDDAVREIPKAFADAQFMEAILRAEYTKQPSDGKKDEADVAAERDRAVARLMEVGRPLERDKSGTIVPIEGYDFEAALVARFLAQQGLWYLGGGKKP